MSTNKLPHGLQQAVNQLGNDCMDSSAAIEAIHAAHAGHVAALARIAELEIERNDLCARLAAITNKAGELASDVRGLVDESEGVAGLHLNGDVADWGSLLPGGRFERLTALDDLEDLLAAAVSEPTLENGLTLAETDASASVAGLTQKTVTIICKTGGLICKGLIECSEHLGGGLCGAGGGFPCEHKWEQKA